MENIVLNQKNVFGEPLEACCKFPMTGYMRDGYCHRIEQDPGQHVICVEMTAEFLKFSREAGNDLTTPMPDYEFPGLIAGDRWCLCLLRWVEAYQNNAAPKVYLEATHESVLKVVPLEVLKEFAADGDNHVI